MSTALADYNGDVIAWANEQAALIRAGKFSQLDIEHIADEIEDVGKSEKHEFENRMAILLAHMLKWKYQSDRKGKSWSLTIKNQRDMIQKRLKKTPSLKPELDDPDFWTEAWTDAIVQAERETGINDFPEKCPWTVEQILNPDFWP